MFAATVAGGRNRYNRTAATVQWSHEVDHRLDFTVFGSAGRSSGSSRGVSTTVDWVGGVTGEARESTFGMLGGRIGVKLGENWQLDGKVSMSAAAGSIPFWSGGLSVKSRF